MENQQGFRNTLARLRPSPKPLDPPSLTYFEGATLCQLRIPTPAPEVRARAKRGKITGFSPASRRDLLRKLNAIDVRLIGVDRVAFVTLTYPAFFVDPINAKRHLKEFLRRLQRVFGRAPLIWKMEPQHRGAPHFHLMVFTASPEQLQQLRAWAPVEWHDIAGHGDPLHLAFHLGKCGNGNKHCVEAVDSWRAIKAYVPKYLGKVTGINCEDWAYPGRWWGTRFYDHLPVRPRSERLSDARAKLAKRLMKRWYEKQPSGRFRVLNPQTGVVFRDYIKPAAVLKLRECGFVVTSINRRWKCSRGGMTLYAPDSLGRALLTWLSRALEVHDAKACGVAAGVDP